MAGSSTADSVTKERAGAASATTNSSSKAKELVNATSEPVEKPSTTEDVVVVHSHTEDGKGMNVVRKRGDELSLGVVRPLEEGKPIVGDVVKLKPRDEHPALFDVETEVALTEPQPKRLAAGPSRVANSSYRKGWDSLWGGRRRRRKPN